MTKLKFRSVALIAAAMLATPAMARESYVSPPHQAVNPMRVPRQEPSILAKGTVFADTKAMMCGAIGAPTMDPCFPQFHDIVATCCDLARHTLMQVRNLPTPLNLVLVRAPIFGSSHCERGK